MWLSSLGIQCCHCCDLGHCCGMGLNPRLGIFVCCRLSQKHQQQKEYLMLKVKILHNPTLRKLQIQLVMEVFIFTKLSVNLKDIASCFGVFFNCFIYLFFFLYFQGHTGSIWKFPGQGLNRSCSHWPTPQLRTATWDPSHFYNLHHSSRLSILQWPGHSSNTKW